MKGVLGLGAVSLLAGCASDNPLDIFQGDGTESQTINDLQIPVFTIAIIVGVLVMAAVLFIVIKFRAKPDDDELPAQTHGALGLELGWTLLPALLLAFVAVGTVVTIFDLADAPEDAMEIDVYGQQWWWGFEYDTDQDGKVILNLMQQDSKALRVVFRVGFQVAQPYSKLTGKKIKPEEFKSVRSVNDVVDAVERLLADA